MFSIFSEKRKAKLRKQKEDVDMKFRGKSSDEGTLFYTNF